MRIEPFNPGQIFINETRQQITPGAQDYTQGAGTSPASPGLPVSSTTPNEDGTGAVSEALFDLSTFDSELDVWG